MKGFIEFIRSQGVIGLAIGFILGGAVSKVVAAFTSDIVNPIIGGFFSQVDALADATVQIGPATILWGDFVVVLIDFIIIAAVVYFIFKGLGLEKIDKKEKK